MVNWSQWIPQLASNCPTIEDLNKLSQNTLFTMAWIDAKGCRMHLWDIEGVIYNSKNKICGQFFDLANLKTVTSSSRQVCVPWWQLGQTVATENLREQGVEHSTFVSSERATACVCAWVRIEKIMLITYLPNPSGDGGTTEWGATGRQFWFPVGMGLLPLGGSVGMSSALTDWAIGYWSGSCHQKCFHNKNSAILVLIAMARCFCVLEYKHNIPLSFMIEYNASGRGQHRGWGSSATSHINKFENATIVVWVAILGGYRDWDFSQTGMTRSTGIQVDHWAMKRQQDKEHAGPD